MLTFAGELTLHSPRRASMAGSVRDVTAHLLDDAQPDAMSQAEPLTVQQIVQAVSEVPAPVAALPSRPAGEPTASGIAPSLQSIGHTLSCMFVQQAHCSRHISKSATHRTDCAACFRFAPTCTKAAAKPPGQLHLRL